MRWPQAEGQRLADMGSRAFNAEGFEYLSPELFSGLTVLIRMAGRPP